MYGVGAGSGLGGVDMSLAGEMSGVGVDPQLSILDRLQMASGKVSPMDALRFNQMLGNMGGQQQPMAGGGGQHPQQSRPAQFDSGSQDPRKKRRYGASDFLGDY